MFAYNLLLRRSQNLDFLVLKNLSPGQFWRAPTHADMIELQLKNQATGNKTLYGFCILILKGVMAF